MASTRRSAVVEPPEGVEEDKIGTESAVEPFPPDGDAGVDLPMSPPPFASRQQASDLTHSASPSSTDPSTSVK